jgi:hypothetical protein
MGNFVIELIERVPLASVLTILTAVGALYALVVGDISFVEFAAVVGGVSAGTGVLGIARNGAGHGTY